MDIKALCSVAWTRRLAVLTIVFLSSLMCAQLAKADLYVTFNTGKLYVFPDSCITSTVTSNGVFIVTAKDGSKFSYPVSGITSIIRRLIKTLPTITSFEFSRENNYQLVADAEGTIADGEIAAEVAGIGKRLTATFQLSDTQARAYCDGKELQSDVSRLRYDTVKVVTVGFPGDLILSLTGDGKYGFRPFGNDYNVNVDFLTDHATTVPRIDINTVGGVPISSKEYYLDAEIIIDGAGVFPSMTDSVKVKGRGNTSWSSNPRAKNPYRLKFDSKKRPLGLRKGKNWVLLANKIYGSMLTNAYGMKAGSLVGTVAANHIIPVDLYVNGTYKGSYNFTEKVGLANNSVDINDETVATLLELDRYYDEAEGQKFRTTDYDVPVNIKSPEFGEDSTFITFAQIETRFNDLVSAVANGEDISKHADMDALVRYMLANELIGNKEIFHPKSTYCYNENILDENSKFVFGPMWDLDWGLGYVEYLGAGSYFTQLTNMDFFNIDYDGYFYEFFNILNKDKKVLRHMYEVWKPFMEEGGIDELCEFCIDYVTYANPSLIKSRSAYPDNTAYASQAQIAVQWLRHRANVIYNRLKEANYLPGDVNDDGKVTISDVTALIDYLLSGDSSSFNEGNADVDGNGIIAIGDVSKLIDNLLAGNV